MIPAETAHVIFLFLGCGHSSCCGAGFSGFLPQPVPSKRPHALLCAADIIKFYLPDRKEKKEHAHTHRH
jgi:hypothetical protein